MFSSENVEPLGEAFGVRDRFRQIAKELAHFRIALQMPLAVLREQFARGIEMGVLANAGENIEHFATMRRRILHAVRGEDRQVDNAPQDRSVAD